MLVLANWGRILRRGVRVRECATWFSRPSLTTVCPTSNWAFLTQELLKGFTSKAICGMNRGNRCSYSSFSLSHQLPRYGHRLWLPKPYLCWGLRSTHFRQASRSLIPLHNLSPTSESHLPLILSYVPPCSTLRPSPEKYADIRQAHGNQHHLSCPANARD
jgi:hypothetical protein